MREDLTYRVVYQIGSVLPSEELVQGRSFRHDKGRHVHQPDDPPFFALVKSVLLAESKRSSSSRDTAVGVTEQQQLLTSIFDQRHTLLAHTFCILLTRRSFGVLGISARVCGHDCSIASLSKTGGKVMVQGSRVPRTRDNDKCRFGVGRRHFASSKQVEQTCKVRGDERISYLLQYALTWDETGSPRSPSLHRFVGGSFPRLSSGAAHASHCPSSQALTRLQESRQRGYSRCEETVGFVSKRSQDRCMPRCGLPLMVHFSGTPMVDGRPAPRHQRGNFGETKTAAPHPCLALRRICRSQRQSDGTTDLSAYHGATCL